MKCSIHASISLILLFMTGCAVRTVPIDEAQFIGEDNEIYKQCAALDLKSQVPNLVVMRDEGFFGGKNPHVIHINGVPCVDLMPGEKLSMTLPLGEHILGTKNRWDPFNIGRLIETQVIIKENKVTIVRDGVDANGVHHINVSAK